jgi:hypothetical protein
MATKRPRRPRDPNQLAKLIVDMATGAAARDPEPKPETPLTEARRKGGLKGGKARAGETRYSPPVVVAAIPQAITGNPEPAHISTSYVERQNLTMRMQMRRFTRLTNAFSKKIENHAAAVALHFMHYNFARIHKTLRVTPAMEAGVSDHVWSLEEIVELAR